MAEYVRTIAARFSRFVLAHSCAPRHRARLPLQVCVADDGEAYGAPRIPALAGYTYDISATGLSLLLPTVVVGNRHLTFGSRVLRIGLRLANGVVNFYAVPVRYEQVESAGGPHFVIGARITAIDGEDRARLAAYLRSLRGVKEKAARGSVANVSY